MGNDGVEQPGLTIAFGQCSVAGCKPENQDFCGASIPKTAVDLLTKGIVVAIADGISTSPVSHLAAQTAVNAVLSDYYDASELWPVDTAAMRVIEATNAWLAAQNTHHGIFDANQGYVCTLSTLILKGREAHIFHIGDTRIARLSGRSFEPMTDDHRAGLGTAHSYLDRAMGIGEPVQVERRVVPVAVGDVFVLSTDGAHDVLSAPLVANAIAQCATLQGAANALVQTALDLGARDNVTVQLLRVETLPDATGAALLADALARPIPALPQAGQVIDGLRVIRNIHTTSRSHVFLVEAPDGTRMALKIPASDLRDDPLQMRRFVLEDWIARRIHSPHVIRAGKGVQPSTGLYVLSEYIEGQTLRQWMTDTPRPDLGQIRDLAEQLARGLRAFHRREMIHQDLRPENILIDRDGTVKIIDLGSTAVAGLEEAAPGLSGALPGTFQYTAPEYMSGDQISWRSDQYSLGVIIYEMLTGNLPYGAQVARIGSRRDRDRLRYRAAHDDDSRAVPLWVDDALRQATHPDPLRRFDALSEFIGALRQPRADFSRHIPFAERDPVRFWKTVSGVLALVVVILAAQLGR
ncbi:hypothetical protein BFP70_06910 [Thioclava sp. SK-1]|uniref:bifunctional protein-serine/threonine kinase/phosphatase n=1 Tax=Thioclava sp. SK-1 TaxID=1889770 RepID=UPI0008269E27|nr:bifunctional protein-serine/threonine kinase/phosphatase [Thioclava sp. SK-1]OCX66169.1 hypothetical protein BFP70_06910 [Thioclava sp. SK-1]